jgi:hypothetical protein
MEFSPERNECVSCVTAWRPALEPAGFSRFSGAKALLLFPPRLGGKTRLTYKSCQGAVPDVAV